MKVQMSDGLPTIYAYVKNGPISRFRKTISSGQFLGRRQRSHQGLRLGFVQ